MKHDLFKLSQEETVSTESEVCCIDCFVSSSFKQLPLHFDLSQTITNIYALFCAVTYVTECRMHSSNQKMMLLIEMHTVL